MPLDRLLRLQVCHRILDEVAAICGSAAVCGAGDAVHQTFGRDVVPACLTGGSASGPLGRCLSHAAQEEGWVRCTEGGGEHRVLALVAGAARIGSVVSGALERALFPSEQLYHLERLLELLVAEIDVFSTLAPNVPAASAPAVPFPELLGDSAPIRAVRAEIRRALAISAPVLIEGEAGTGKDLVAWLIHDRGPRRSGPYVTLNCAGMAEGPVESALFGHRRASFPGAHGDRTGVLVAAKGGTLFLDEVGELSPGVQPKLLRALDTGEVLALGGHESERTDARLLAATKVDLEAEVRAGRFQPDLFDRLRALHIRMPALRDRPEDLPLLAAHALESVCARLRIPLRCFSRDVITAFIAARWPGNIRQLIEEIERAVVASDEPEITLDQLSMEFREAHQRSDLSFLAVRQRVIDAWERAEVLRGLERTNWNVAALAEELEMSKRALFERLARLGLKRPPVPDPPRPIGADRPAGRK